MISATHQINSRSFSGHTAQICANLTELSPLSDRLIVVLVDASRAEGHIPSVLLDVRLGPAAEGHEVRERRVVVVVRVPQGVLAELRGTAHDRGPLAVAAVDAYSRARR